MLNLGLINQLFIFVLLQCIACSDISLWKKNSKTSNNDIQCEGYCWPIERNTYSLTQYFRHVPEGDIMRPYYAAITCYRHEGIDMIGAPRKGPVYAIDSGRVVEIGYASSAYGVNSFKIQHDNGLISIYGHMESRSQALYAGANVKKGQYLGTMGRLGNVFKDPNNEVSGVHLHLTIMDPSKSSSCPKSDDFPNGIRIDDWYYTDPLIELCPDYPQMAGCASVANTQRVGPSGSSGGNDTEMSETEEASRGETPELDPIAFCSTLELPSINTCASSKDEFEHLTNVLVDCKQHQTISCSGTCISNAYGTDDICPAPPATEPVDLEIDPNLFCESLELPNINTCADIKAEYESMTNILVNCKERILETCNGACIHNEFGADDVCP